MKKLKIFEASSNDDFVVKDVASIASKLKSWKEKNFKDSNKIGYISVSLDESTLSVKNGTIKSPVESIIYINVMKGKPCYAGKSSVTHSSDNSSKQLGDMSEVESEIEKLLSKADEWLASVKEVGFIDHREYETKYKNDLIKEITSLLKGNEKCKVSNESPSSVDGKNEETKVEINVECSVAKVSINLFDEDDKEFHVEFGDDQFLYFENRNDGGSHIISQSYYDESAKSASVEQAESLYKKILDKIK